MSVISNQYVASIPELSSAVFRRFLVDWRNRNTIPANQLYFARYKVFPCRFFCQKPELNALFHVTSVLNYLKNEYNHNVKNDIISQKYHTKSKQYFAGYRLCDLGNGIMICMKDISVGFGVENPSRYSPDFLDDYFLVTRMIRFYYLPELDTQVKNLAQELLNMSVSKSKLVGFQMICVKPLSGYYFTNIGIKKPLIYDLALHYGQDFVEIHDKILKGLNKPDGNGIVLLHGTPGSGKTHYIRYLMDEIQGKILIYIPPDMAKDLSKPEFLTFLLHYPDSILIIEDAENIIRDRNANTFNATQAVANLLNLSDGLLGDALHMQIIATFNCDLTVIDKALLRPGRLIAMHNFQKLDVENAKMLSNKLGFGTENILTSMSLAEIYNQNKEDDNEAIV